MNCKLNSHAIRNCFGSFSGPQKIKGFKYVLIRNREGDSIPLEVSDVSLCDQEAKLYLNGLLAFKNNLPLNEPEVCLEVLGERIFSPIQRVAMYPESTNDWELVMDSKLIIQENLLSQIHCIQEGMIVPFWCDNICMFLRVGTFEPCNQFGLLTSNTEVVVETEPDRNQTVSPNTNSMSQTVPVDKTMTTSLGVDVDHSIVSANKSHSLYQRVMSLLDLVFFLIYGRSFSLFQQQKTLLKYWNNQFSTVTYGLSNDTPLNDIYRIQEYINNDPLVESFLEIPSAVLFTSTHLGVDPNCVFIAQFSLFSDEDALSSIDENVLYLPLSVKHFPSQDNPNPHNNSPSCNDFLTFPSLWFQQDSLKVGNKVRMQLVNFNNHAVLPQRLTLHVIRVDQLNSNDTSPQRGKTDRDSLIYSMAFQEWLRRNVSQDLPLVVNCDKGALIRVPLDAENVALIRVRLTEKQFSSSNSDSGNISPFFLLHDVTVKGMQIKVEFVPEQSAQSKLSEKDSFLNESNELPLDSVRTEISRHLEKCLLHTFNRRGGSNRTSTFLIIGKSGSGKTTLLSQMSHAVSSAMWVQAYCVVINGKTLIGKSLDSLRKIFTKIARSVLNKEPSLLVMDNLDALCPRLDPTNSSSAEMTVHNAVALMMRDMLSSFGKSKRRVVVIASVQSSVSLHPYLVSHPGACSFHSSLHMPPLSEEVRSEIFLFHLNRHLKMFSSVDTTCNVVHSTDVCLNILRQSGCGQLDACLPHDLSQLAKCVACNRTRTESFNLPLSVTEIVTALSQYRPLTLRGFSSKFVDAPSRSGDGASTFASIAGYTKVKEILREVFHWPIKYRHIYSQCPISLQHGVLLYGPPGCGKTFMGKALAAEIGMNFILVKGPELLNKYVGSSEKAVRELFQRARNAAPCLIFFDEFESLAPRRGHDVTGVTDRVVNQLLAETDGFEEQGEVYLLAASNRPDLIDPALLRPGRLQVKIHVDLPDEMERQLVIKNLLQEQLKLQIEPPDYGEEFEQDLVERSHGYTVADLKGLLQLVKIEALRDNDQRTLEYVHALKEHVNAAYHIFKPSRQMELDFGNLWNAQKSIYDVSHQKASLA